jgi:fructan beta-fructosidase
LKIKRLVVTLIGILILLVGCSEVDQDEKGESDLKAVGLSEKQAANADYYTEMYRPQYHFSTPSGNLADPNGLIYFEGEYHLFHQKNGNWAHAVSTDMLHWEHLPVALEHDLLGQALSGSTVVDWSDSSGLFDGKAGLVAFYTSTEGGEAQGMAYSGDKGRTWKRYKGNPIIENPGIKDFRDPKVFWHEETNKWVMVISTNQSVTFYNSDNLIEWTFQSQFGDDEGSHVAVWECPDLFQLPVNGDQGNQKWVLHVSVGDNDTTNGSTAQYFIGEFDGTTFVNDNSPETVITTDFGQDFYAAQSFSDIPDEDGRRIWLGWMANWRYPYQSPTDPWMGSMSIPRELSLRTIEDGSIRLFQGPIQEIESLRANAHHVEAFRLEGDYPIDAFASTTFEFEMIVEWDDVEEFGIRLRQSEEEEAVFGVDTVTNKIFLDRSNAGLEQLTDRNGNMYQFGNRHETDYPMERKRIKIRGLVDESSVELFVNEGEFAFTKLIYTKPTNNAIELYTKGGSVDIVQLNFFELHSTWRERPQVNEMTGIVVSEEYVTLKVGEVTTIQANVKPNGYDYDEGYRWEVEQSNVVGITEQDDSAISLEALEPGVTNITVSDAGGKVTKVMKVRVHS